MNTKLPDNPTATANYIVSDQIIFGQYPSAPDQNELRHNSIAELLKHGRDVFVNAVPLWERRGRFDYTAYVSERVPDAIFIDYPLTDGRTPENPKEFSKLIMRLHSLLQQGKNLYIHCAKGHGRSALIVGCLLVQCGHSPDEVIMLLRETHGTRKHNYKMSCPQNKDQRDFIRGYSAQPQSDDVSSV